MANKKISRAHKFMDAAHIQGLLEQGITINSLAEQFGNTLGAVRDWVKENKAPKWTRLAAEALERRMGRGGWVYLVVKLPKKYLDVLRPLLSSWGAIVTMIDV